MSAHSSSSVDLLNNVQSTLICYNFVDVQGISTPKTIPKKAYPTWTSCDISPISGQNSDPELSSTEKSKPIPYANNTIRKQKSVDQLNRQIPEFRKFNDIRTISIKKGSYPDLKSGLRKPTNLNSMGHTLKGSYTSLKPLCTNLPIAPPPLNSVNTRTTFIPPSGQVSFFWNLFTYFYLCLF